MEQSPPSRFDQLVNDPDRYFQEAWVRASAQVDQQIKREAGQESQVRRPDYDTREVLVLARLMRRRFGRTRLEATQDATAILDALAPVRLDLD